MLQKLKPLFVSQTLKKTAVPLFTPLEFCRIFHASRSAAQWFLKTYTKKGLFIKLRNGLYSLSDTPINHYLIANRVYQPSYISFETALSHHGMIPETIYSVTSATAKISREFTVAGVQYLYRKIKKDAYTGYTGILYNGHTVFMAEPEKALLDYLYFVDLGECQFSYERLNLGRVKKAKFFLYSALYKRRSLVRLSQKIYDQFRDASKFK